MDFHNSNGPVLGVQSEAKSNKTRGRGNTDVISFKGWDVISQKSFYGSYYLVSKGITREKETLILEILIQRSTRSLSYENKKLDSRYYINLVWILIFSTVVSYFQ